MIPHTKLEICTDGKGNATVTNNSSNIHYKATTKNVYINLKKDYFNEKNINMYDLIRTVLFQQFSDSQVQMTFFDY